MKNNFLEARPDLRKMIRIAEIVVVTALAVYALLTYRELQRLRAAPVVLPSYWFNVATGSDQTQVERVHARGSWVSKGVVPEFLHTTTIECVKARMQCMESSAVVAVNEGGFLESIQTLFDVDTWSEKQILTKVDVQPCAIRTLVLDIANKQAQNVVTPRPGNKSCKAGAIGEQVFRLEAGQHSRAGAADKTR